MYPIVQSRHQIDVTNLHAKRVRPDSRLWQGGRWYPAGATDAMRFATTVVFCAVAAFGGFPHAFPPPGRSQ